MADELWEAAAVEIDDGKRKDLFTRFQLEVIKDLPSVTTVVTPDVTTYNRSVHDQKVGAEGIGGNLAHAYFGS